MHGFFGHVDYQNWHICAGWRHYPPLWQDGWDNDHSWRTDRTRWQRLVSLCKNLFGNNSKGNGQQKSTRPQIDHKDTCLHWISRARPIQHIGNYVGLQGHEGNSNPSPQVPSCRLRGKDKVQGTSRFQVDLRLKLAGEALGNRVASVQTLDGGPVARRGFEDGWLLKSRGTQHCVETAPASPMGGVRLGLWIRESLTAAAHCPQVQARSTRSRPDKEDPHSLALFWKRRVGQGTKDWAICSRVSRRRGPEGARTAEEAEDTTSNDWSVRGEEGASNREMWPSSKAAVAADSGGAVTTTLMPPGNVTRNSTSPCWLSRPWLMQIGS